MKKRVVLRVQDEDRSRDPEQEQGLEEAQQVDQQEVRPGDQQEAQQVVQQEGHRQDHLCCKAHPSSQSHRRR